MSRYGRSKLAAEDALRRMADELPIQIVRPSAVFGESDIYMLSLFNVVRQALADAQAPVGDR